jgi:5-methylcytosine-specific restriction endonuclease McrBC regulatory subunit McrC
MTAAPVRGGVSVRIREWRRTHLPAGALEAAGTSAPLLAEALEPLVQTTPGWRDEVRLAAKGRVGELQIGRLHVGVVPHLPAGDVLTLFAWARGVRLILDHRRLGVEGTAPSLAELLAAALIQEATHLLEGDLLRRSLRREERRFILRGQPRFEQCGLRPPQQGLDCRFFEVSTDTLENRLVRAGLEAALKRVGRQPRLLPSAVRALGVFRDLCVAIHPTRQDFDKARERRGPRTASYRNAHRLARWLLLGGGPLASWGLGGVTGWTLDMAGLFESAVARGVGAWARRHGWTVREQPRDRRAIQDRTGATYREIRPDLEVLDRDRRVLAIVDAKYKGYGLATDGHEPIRKVDNDDIYQLAFYGERAGPTVPLFIISPAGEEHELADRYRRLKVGGRGLELLSVDLQRLVVEQEISLPGLLRASEATP